MYLYGQGIKDVGFLSALGSQSGVSYPKWGHQLSNIGSQGSNGVAGVNMVSKCN